MWIIMVESNFKAVTDDGLMTFKIDENGIVGYETN